MIRNLGFRHREGGALARISWRFVRNCPIQSAATASARFRYS